MVSIIIMKIIHTDLHWQGTKKQPMPNLRTIRDAKFQKGSTSLFYKTSSSDTEFKEVQMLTAKARKSITAHSHDDNEPWKSISLQKRGRPGKLADVQMPRLYSAPRPIAKAKVDNVKSLFDFKQAVHHGFYNDVVVDMRKNNSNVVELVGDDDSD